MSNIDKQLLYYRNFILRNKATDLIDWYDKKEKRYAEKYGPYYGACSCVFIERAANSSTYSKTRHLLRNLYGYIEYSPLGRIGKMGDFLLGIYIPSASIGDEFHILAETDNVLNKIVVTTENKFIIPFLRGTTPIPMALSFVNYSIYSPKTKSCPPIYLYWIIYDKSDRLDDDFLFSHKWRTYEGINTIKVIPISAFDSVNYIEPIKVIKLPEKYLLPAFSYSAALIQRAYHKKNNNFTLRSQMRDLQKEVASLKLKIRELEDKIDRLG